MLYLKEAGMGDAAQIYAFYSQLPADENGLTNPYAGMDEAEFVKDALPVIIANARGEMLPEGFVPATEYFLWEDHEIVGLFRLRHHLNDFLRENAGHVGFAIRKDCRGRGLAQKGLMLLLARAKEIIPEDEVYMSVNRDNPASLAVQKKCGAKIVRSDEGKHYTRIRIR